jgi:hypothetical protein
MTTIQLNKKSKEYVYHSVYSIIKNYNGKATRKRIEKEIDSSKYELQYAILRLIKEGKIKRIRGFGLNRIEYYYQDMISNNSKNNNNTESIRH